MKFHHVGIFVSDIKIGREYLVKFLPFNNIQRYHVSVSDFIFWGALLEFSSHCFFEVQ